MTNSKYLKVAIKAAKEAEKVITAYYGKPVRYGLKKDKSPVTLADTKAEKIIKAVIKKAFPGHGFIGEEGGSENGRAEYRWIIDPIDGTKNFTRGIPFFSTLIALAKGDQIVLGLSNNPGLGELLTAEKGKGAYLNGKAIRVSKVRRLADAFICYGGVGYFKDHQRLERLGDFEKAVYGHRGWGDSFAYHLLAQGKSDIVMEYKVRIWDVAALKVIVEEAGGRMTEMGGSEITVDSRTALTTNGILHERAVEFFK